MLIHISLDTVTIYTLYPGESFHIYVREPEFSERLLRIENLNFEFHIAFKDIKFFTIMPT